MSQTSYVILMAAVAGLALLGMWFAWRARARRDRGVEAPAAELSGATLLHLPRASYVSTTPEGSPFERVSIPSLRYKGYAELTVLSDGVIIAVTGETPVRIPAGRLRGTGTASGRVGKAVERDGLSLLRWAAGERVLESSFRLANPAEQAAFAKAIDQISTHASTSREGAK
ncbi:hypothetical protein [Leucobacter massiliensis]|uniref:PH domain-containing protein n=1 Tax=Leucobacter massiliensis TaxID=1686285 RepID=A0A2S9QRJ3_9MICO|nr:hypothetical protein [Leucobacter massiliensis]PRI12209.1 hypothetical protein B4915_03925 [Leucobacter massiliensis]